MLAGELGVVQIHVADIRAAHDQAAGDGHVHRLLGGAAGADQQPDAHALFLGDDVVLDLHAARALMLIELSARAGLPQRVRGSGRRGGGVLGRGLGHGQFLLLAGVGQDGQDHAGDGQQGHSHDDHDHPGAESGLLGLNLNRRLQTGDAHAQGALDGVGFLGHVGDPLEVQHVVAVIQAVHHQ